MKKETLLALILIGAFWGGFALADVKKSSADYGDHLSEIKTKIELIVKNQEKLDTIIANQGKLIGMLRIMRRSN